MQRSSEDGGDKLVGVGRQAIGITVWMGALCGGVDRVGCRKRGWSGVGVFGGMREAGLRGRRQARRHRHEVLDFAEEEEDSITSGAASMVCLEICIR